MKRLVIIGLVFSRLSSMEKSEIALCNLTPLDQTFVYAYQKNKDDMVLVLKPFTAHVMKGNKFFIQHISQGKIKAQHAMYKEPMGFKGHFVLIIASNHFSSKTDRLEQFLSIDPDVSNNYMQDIQKIGAQAVVEDIMNPENVKARLYGKYAKHITLKEESLGNKDFLHPLKYCNNSYLISILSFVFNCLPKTVQQQYGSYLVVSKQYHELMNRLREKFYHQKQD